jgi:4-hydroxy-3-methylbut-2-enyl diphosphate reductase
MAEKTLAENPRVALYSLGPLVHNARVVGDLRARGLTPVDDISQVSDGIVIVRAHGIGPEQRKECERPGVRCIDATCPKVLRIQQMVRQYDEEGYLVIIAGEPQHDEVKGIRGFARRSFVVENTADARMVPLGGPAVVVSQTTLPRSQYAEICQALRTREPGVLVQDTSCVATETRQESLVRLASRVEAILVIGGRDSANTRWLHQAALATGRPAWHVEGVSDLPAEIGGFERVGLTAGASTPDWIIDEVEAELRGIQAKR